MKITDLIQEFEITYDLGGLGLPGFEEDEIKELLELSQYRIINQRLQGNNVYNSKYPDTIKRIDDLQGLVTQASQVYGGQPVQAGFAWGFAADEANVIEITLPDNYLHLVEGGITIYDGTYLETAIQIPMEWKLRVSKSRRNSAPYLKSPVFHFVQVNSLSYENKAIRLYQNTDTGGSTINKVKLLYIRIPVNLTTVGDNDDLIDFNDDVYHEIVAGAVDHAITIASPNKAQVSQQSLNKIE